MRRGDDKSGKPLALDMDLIYLPASNNQEHTSPHPISILWRAHIYFETLFIQVLSIIDRFQINLQEQPKDTTPAQSFTFRQRDEQLCAPFNNAAVTRQRGQRHERNLNGKMRTHVLSLCYTPKKYIQNQHEGQILRVKLAATFHLPHDISV